MSDEYPDVEGGFKDYLRSRSRIQTLIGNRVFLEANNAVESDYPLIEIQRVGGGDDNSEAALDNAVLQVDLWGQLRNRAGLKPLYQAVRAECRLITVAGAVELRPGMVAYGAVVNTAIYLPNPADDRPHYVLTVAVTASEVA